MRTFKTVVDYDDPTHRELLPTERCEVNLERWTELFPIRGKGKAEVEFEFADMRGRNSSAKNQLDALAASGLEKPDFAEHRSFHAAYPEERLIAPVISFVGNMIPAVAGPAIINDHIAWIFADDDVFKLSYRWLGGCSGVACRVLGVRKRTPIPP